MYNYSYVDSTNFFFYFFSRLVPDYPPTVFQPPNRQPHHPFPVLFDPLTHPTINPSHTCLMCQPPHADFKPPGNMHTICTHVSLLFFPFLSPPKHAYKQLYVCFNLIYFFSLTPEHMYEPSYACSVLFLSFFLTPGAHVQAIICMFPFFFFFSPLRHVYVCFWGLFYFIHVFFSYFHP